MIGRIELAVLVAFCLAAGAMFFLHRHGAAAPTAHEPAPAPVLPGLALGQHAVAPERQWLLIQPGS